MPIKEVEEFLDEEGISNFIDPNFPPRDSSIYE